MNEFAMATVVASQQQLSSTGGMRKTGDKVIRRVGKRVWLDPMAIAKGVARWNRGCAE